VKVFIAVVKTLFLFLCLFLGGGGFPGYQESIFLLGYPPEKQFGLA
jgi:hypothetical protein